MLFHFSDGPGINRFVPRPVKTPVRRPAGQEWLNGPLVWAISAAYAFLYLFPRECPRIVAWATKDTAAADQAAWLGPHRRVAYVETAWMPRIARARIYRYTLADDSFVALEDVGMHVSRADIVPTGMTTLTDLPTQLTENEVCLRAVPSLVPLKPLWDTSLHVSGIRSRHATGWY